MTKNNNALYQMRGESLEQFVERVRNMNSEERFEAAERQRNAVLDGYHNTSKQSDYKRRVYHK